MSPDESARLVYLLALLALIGTGSGLLHRTGRQQKIAHALMWLAIIVGIAALYHILNVVRGSV